MDNAELLDRIDAVLSEWANKPPSSGGDCAAGSAASLRQNVFHEALAAKSAGRRLGRIDACRVLHAMAADARVSGAVRLALREAMSRIGRLEGER